MSSEIFGYASIPVIAIVIGGIIGSIQQPSTAFNSTVLHFAAGVVFSVATVELLPDIIKKHAPLEVAIGFGLGTAAMLLVKFLAEKLADESDTTIDSKVLPIGMLVALAIDLAIDGLLLGVGFAAGNKEGILLSMALGVEVFSLGLAVGLTCKKRDILLQNSLIILLGLGMTSFVGSMIGTTFLINLSRELLELVLSFGLAALLFLVTEELLTEAHEEEDTLLQTSAFFGGFLLFLIIAMVV
ncbi:transporter [Chamaesiphon polymorphus CCALA 037]|uniref:Transporter n=2 Tax=Chamaesiphon TaxID=217161 RepID=A0A2T1GGZ6_9CYAN|nr:transporter [Chamaesiphon polymorphus CCALA 037]